MTATPCPYCTQPASPYDGQGDNEDRYYRCGTVNTTRTTACRTYEASATTEAAEATIAAANEARVWDGLGHGPLASLSSDDE